MCRGSPALGGGNQGRAQMQNHNWVKWPTGRRWVGSEQLWARPREARGPSTTAPGPVPRALPPHRGQGGRKEEQWLFSSLAGTGTTLSFCHRLQSSPQLLQSAPPTSTCLLAESEHIPPPQAFRACRTKAQRSSPRPPPPRPQACPHSAFSPPGVPTPSLFHPLQGSCPCSQAEKTGGA